MTPSRHSRVSVESVRMPMPSATVLAQAMTGRGIQPILAWPSSSRSGSSPGARRGGIPISIRHMRQLPGEVSFG